VVSPELAALAMVLSSLSVTLNTLTLRRFRTSLQKNYGLQNTNYEGQDSPAVLSPL
jgi:hypothetical protein